MKKLICFIINIISYFLVIIISNMQIGNIKTVSLCALLIIISTSNYFEGFVVGREE